MQTTNVSDIELHLFENLSAFDSITHFVTSRRGGYSAGNFQGFNVGFNVGDDNWNVLRNRKILSGATNIPLESFTFANQCHGSNIMFVGNPLRGCGAADEKSSLENTDGMITAVTGICIAVQVADCVPILLYDHTNHVAAAIHAGWKGTISQIAAKAIEKMIHCYGSKPANIIVGIGPSIGPCCYEVGLNVYNEFRYTGFSNTDVLIPAQQKDKYFFNLWQANKNQLIELGVKAENIETASICTKCNCEEFFSARASDHKTGRFAAGIMLKNPKQIPSSKSKKL